MPWHHPLPLLPCHNELGLFDQASRLQEKERAEASEIALSETRLPPLVLQGRVQTVQHIVVIYLVKDFGLDKGRVRLDRLVKTLEKLIEILLANVLRKRNVRIQNSCLNYHIG